MPSVMLPTLQRENHKWFLKSHFQIALSPRYGHWDQCQRNQKKTKLKNGIQGLKKNTTILWEGWYLISYL